MAAEGFNYKLSDAQGTAMEPLSVSQFDFDKYGEYESALLEKCGDFNNRGSGVLVYRRFRVPEVFSWGCASASQSLEWQLGALSKSMAYQADIPNFLEPWYGIGVVAGAFGVPYVWKEGQAPAVEPPFTTTGQALSALKCSIAEGEAGRRNLEMLEYFLEETKGRLPVSCGDVQSPLNIASSYLMDTTSFMLEMYDDPEGIEKFLGRIADLEIEYYSKQIDMIGDALARPGHGFASCRQFSGLGFSDDNFTLMGNDHYRQFAAPALSAVGNALGGTVFHSCGNWADRADAVLEIPGVLMADGAVGGQTDPDANTGETLGKAFAGTGKILHVRIVGNEKTVLGEVEKLWQPGLKLIVATYCETPEEQQKVYDGIHRICR